MELDIIENNGNCLGQTTWHVWGNKDGGCDQNGCYGQYHFDDGCQFHMRTEFGEDGSLTQYKNGQVIEVNGGPSEDEKKPDQAEHGGHGRCDCIHAVDRLGSRRWFVRWERFQWCAVCCHQCGGPCTTRNQIWATTTHLLSHHHHHPHPHRRLPLLPHQECARPLSARTMMGLTCSPVPKTPAARMSAAASAPPRMVVGVTLGFMRPANAG